MRARIGRLARHEKLDVELSLTDTETRRWLCEWLWLGEPLRSATWW